MTIQSILERHFQVTQRGSTVTREIMAGMTSFLCVSYVLAVNPIILGAGGMPPGAVFTATAVTAMLITLLLGLYGKVPYIGVAGMGINAYIAYTVCLQMGHSVPFAMTAMILSGILFLVIALTPIKTYLFNAIPLNLKMAVTAGIGLFITLIGLSSAGIIVPNEGTIIGIGNLMNPTVWVATIGVFLIAILTARGVSGAMFYSIITCAILGFIFNLSTLPEAIVSTPPSMGPLFLQWAGDEIFTIDMFFVVFTILFVNVFNVVGVVIGLHEQAQIPAEAQDEASGKCMQLCALGTTIGGMLGTSPHIVAVESAPGIAVGGRTGLTAVTAAILFGIALFFAPLLQVIPAAATAPVLIVVGLYMMMAVRAIDFDDITEAVPAFLTIVMMPFAYSIGVGIEWGMVSYVVIQVLSGHRTRVSGIMYVLAALFILKEILPYIV